MFGGGQRVPDTINRLRRKGWPGIEFYSNCTTTSAWEVSAITFTSWTVRSRLESKRRYLVGDAVRVGLLPMFPRAGSLISSQFLLSRFGLAWLHNRKPSHHRTFRTCVLLRRARPCQCQPQ